MRSALRMSVATGLVLAGCGAAPPVTLRNPGTQEVIRCEPGAKVRFAGDRQFDDCVSAYERAGWTRRAE
jgi:hypothetical protein